MAINEKVSKLIYQDVNNEQQSSEEGTQLRFKSFKPKREIFRAVLKDLMNKRDGVGVFYDGDKNRKGGYLSDVYGCTALLSLANDGSVELNKEQRDSLTNNIRYIIKEIKEYGFTLYPYINSYDNTISREKDGVMVDETLFGHHYPYTGALTWTISFLTSVKKATKKPNPEVNAEEHRYLDLDAEIIRDINNLIVTIVDHFNTSVIKTADPDNPEKTLYLGWSFTNGCLEPSLFFTYSVLEAFSDFEDNVLDLVMDENGYVINEYGNITRQFKESESDLAELFSTRTGLNGVESWANACASAAKNIWKVYGRTLRNDFVDDKFLNGFGVVTLDDIMKMDHSNALFNNVFLVSSLLYGWTNVLIPEEQKEIVSTMEISLQNVQRAIDYLKRKNRDYIVESYTIPFTNLHKEYGDLYIRKLNYRRLDDTTILPILIKANNMIAVYITKYPVKKMDELFEEIFDESNMSDKEVLWDDRGYDVKITERYIEAISQFYAYYISYEEDYTNGFKNAKEEGYLQGRREGIALQRKKNKEELDAKDAEKDAAIAATKEEFTIENAIMKKMNLLAEQAIINALETASERLAKRRWNSKKQKEIVTYEDKIEAIVISLVDNYLASKIKALQDLEGRALNEEEIVKGLANDLAANVKRIMEKEGEQQ